MIKKSFKKVNPGNFTITKKSPGEYVIKRNNRTIEIETSLDKARGAMVFYKKYFAFKPRDRRAAAKANLF
jgi:hypothetical protein